MADDDETGEVGASGDPIEPVVRRATFTPPAEGEGGVHDDDALADALAAEFARIASGPIPIVPQARAAEPQAASEDEDPIVAGPPAAAPPAYEPPAYHTPAYEPPVVPEYPASAPVEEAAWQSPTVAEPSWQPPTEAAPAWEAPTPAEPVWEEPAAEAPSEPAQPAWMNLPAPDPAQAVDLPEGPPQRPVRRSLPDDQLAGWVDEAAKEPGGTLNVIEGLESQLRLREEEAREFQAWEQTMRATGTPDAIAEVEDARPEFTGVLPDLTGAVAGPAVEPPEAPKVPSAFEQAAAPELIADPPAEPEPFVETPVEVEPEPFVEPAAPDESWSHVEEPSVAEPSPIAEPEPFVEPQPEPEAVAPVWPEPAPESPPEDLYRPPTGWFIPAPLDPASPETDVTDAHTEPEAQLEPVADAFDSDVPPGPVTGTFVLPESPLAAWPPPRWDEADAGTPPPVVAEPSPATTFDDLLADAQPNDSTTDDLTTGDVPVDAAPAWNLDDDDAAAEPVTEVPAAAAPEPIVVDEEPAPAGEPMLADEPAPAVEPSAFEEPAPAAEESGTGGRGGLLPSRAGVRAAASDAPDRDDRAGGTGRPCHVRRDARSVRRDARRASRGDGGARAVPVRSAAARRARAEVPLGGGRGRAAAALRGGGARASSFDDLLAGRRRRASRSESTRSPSRDCPPRRCSSSRCPHRRTSRR